jgi:hypothetical protein
LLGACLEVVNYYLIVLWGGLLLLWGCLLVSVWK